jgi:hypothetical protein
MGVVTQCNPTALTGKVQFEWALLIHPAVKAGAPRATIQPEPVHSMRKDNQRVRSANLGDQEVRTLIGLAHTAQSGAPNCRGPEAKPQEHHSTGGPAAELRNGCFATATLQRGY